MIESTWNELTRLEEHIKSVAPGTDEYSKVLRQIQHLIQIQDLVAPEYRGATESGMDKVLNNPAVVGVIGNIVVALMILNYERMGIITSRAFSFIRPK